MIYIQTTERWNRSRLSSLFIENSKKNSAFDEQRAYQFFFGSIIPKKEYDFTEDLIDTYRKYTIVQPGDIMINGLNLNYDFVTQRVGLVKEKGIITSAYLSLRPRKDLNTQYYSYLLKTVDAQKMFHGLGTGIRLTLSYKDIKNLMLPVPTRDEQDQIVRFLDWKVSGINKLIWIKRKQIAELEEMKKICINDAVTGKTLTCTDTKDSGFDFIGEIPSPWEVIKLKWLLTTSLQYGANATGIEFDASLPRYIRITDITIDNKLKETGKLSLPSKDALPYMLEDNDILFARSGATVGKSFIYKKKYGISAFAGYLIRAKIDTNKALPEFVYAITLSKFYELWKNKIFVQATIQNISAEKYNNLPIPLPPIEEQKAIVDYIKAAFPKYDIAIANLQKGIDTLEEYKTKLIADVVTGKIDVRGIEIPEYEFVEAVGIEDAGENSDDNDEQEE